VPGMVPEDVYELTGVLDPRVSPDGGRVAYVVWRIDREANEYRSAVWIAAVDPDRAEPRRLTSGLKRDGSPRWSPDGTRLAFVSNREYEREGSESSVGEVGGSPQATAKKKNTAGQLYVLSLSGGEPVRLTDCRADVGEPAWSPDGSRIAFTSRVPDPAYDEEDDRKRPPRRFTRLQFKLDSVGWTGDRRQHVFVVAADGSAAPTQLTDGDFEDDGPAWSPDGERIAFASAREEDWDVSTVRDLYVVPAGGGEPERLTEGGGYSEHPSWSPDGGRIAYQHTPGVFDEPRHTQVAVLEVASASAPSSGDVRVLTDSLDRNCGPYPSIREPVWDGDDVVFGVEDGGNTHVYRVPADGSGKPELVVGGELQVTGYDVASGRLVHTLTTPTQLSELFVGERRVTSVGRELVDRREVIAPERFTATSEDGTEVDAWIMRPAGFEEGKRYPTLLNIHGGPFTQYGNRFFDEFQVYAGAGYVVVFANPRGSSGYSEAWGRAIRGPVAEGPGWGTRDYEDLMAVVDEAVRRFDFVDPERLGVMGGSYGGYMTSWMLGHTDRFKAACSERSCNNFLLEGGSADIGWMFKGELGAFWFEAPEAYLKVSPSTYAKDIHTPLLILHSEDDLRCPVGHAEDLFTILRLLKRDVEMVRFPAESHELTRGGAPRHREQRFELLLEWFGEKL
jgi:dipeptidyl aminopeptidase/acylaminoacyl peptidase